MKIVEGMPPLSISPILVQGPLAVNSNGIETPGQILEALGDLTPNFLRESSRRKLSYPPSSFFSSRSSSRSQTLNQPTPQLRFDEHGSGIRSAQPPIRIIDAVMRHARAAQGQIGCSIFFAHRRYFQSYNLATCVRDPGKRQFSGSFTVSIFSRTLTA